MFARPIVPPATWSLLRNHRGQIILTFSLICKQSHVTEKIRTARVIKQTLKQ